MTSVENKRKHFGRFEQKHANNFIHAVNKNVRKDYGLEIVRSNEMNHWTDPLSRRGRLKSKLVKLFCEADTNRVQCK